MKVEILDEHSINLICSNDRVLHIRETSDGNLSISDIKSKSLFVQHDLIKIPLDNINEAKNIPKDNKKINAFLESVCQEIEKNEVVREHLRPMLEKFIQACEKKEVGK